MAQIICNGYQKYIDYKNDKFFNYDLIEKDVNDAADLYR